MVYDFKEFDAHIKDTVDWLTKEFTAIRTGRATPTLLDTVSVESYGAKVPIQQVGSVGVEDARTLRIVPWDQSHVKGIEKAITDSDLGVSVIADERGIRVIFPELTSERREQLVKLAKTKLEDAKVSLRKLRDEAMRNVEAKEKLGEMGKDEKFRTKEELQKRVDAANKVFDLLLEKKEAEISN